ASGAARRRSVSAWAAQEAASSQWPTEIRAVIARSDAPIATASAAAEPPAGTGVASANASRRSPTGWARSGSSTRPFSVRRRSEGAKAREERLEQARVRLVALRRERALEIRERLGPEPCVGLGARDDLVEPGPCERQLLRRLDPTPRGRR